MNELRRPFLVIALILMAIVVILEVGAFLGLDPGRDAGRGAKVLEVPGLTDLLVQAGIDPAGVDPVQIQATADAHPEPPGLAIPTQALVDGLVLFSVVLMALPLLFPERITGRTQGIATLIVAIIVIVVGILEVVAAVDKIVCLVSGFLAPPFGTIAYFALFGFFPKGTALAVLSVLMALKLAVCVVLFLAQQRVVQNKGFVLLMLSALATNIVITFLHGVVPSVLVSITDAIAAIVVGIVAAVWAIVMLVIAIISIVRSARFDRAM
jgi:hypothetical protein